MILTSKIIESVIGLVELIIFTFNKKIITEMKQLFCCLKKTKFETINCNSGNSSSTSNTNFWSEGEQEIALTDNSLV